MDSKKKTADRIAAIRAAAEKVKTKTREEITAESVYGSLSPQERNIAATRDGSLNTGRRAVEVAPVREIDPSTYVPQQTKKPVPFYGATDKPAPVEAPKAAAGPSPVQSRAAAVEQVLQAAKRKKQEASSATKLPSGAKAGPAVEKAAGALVQPSKPKAKPAAKPAPSPAPSAKKAAPKKAAAPAQKPAPKPSLAEKAQAKAAEPAAKKAASVEKSAPAKKPVAKAAAKKAAVKKAAPVKKAVGAKKPTSKAASHAKAASAPTKAPAAAPATVPAKVPKRLPRFGGGTVFGLGLMANAAVGFYDSYTREKARKGREGK